MSPSLSYLEKRFFTNHVLRSWIGISCSYTRVTSFQQIQVASFQEPVVATPAVQLLTPPLKPLSIVVERLKGMNTKILLRANMMGELALGIETDLVFLNNVWTDLLPPGNRRKELIF
jgi:hypothetical protein